MAKRRTIEHLEFGKMFGADVIRGYIDGRQFMALIRWTARNRAGVSFGQLGTDEILAIGSYKRGHGFLIPREWLRQTDGRSKCANS